MADEIRSAPEREGTPIVLEEALRAALAGADCRYCSHHGLSLEMRLESKPLGTWSLSGMQMKVIATHHPYAVCPSCGHASRGEPA